MTQHLIAPSILSANFACLGDEVEKVLEAGADLIHFDVMDNHFVPNLTFGPMICKALRDHGVKAQIDVHLMTDPVDNLAQMFADAGATMISFHPEATKDVKKTIKLIKDSGCKVGVALNPETSLNVIDDILNELDMILIMTVNPGFGGQKFMTEVLDKIKAARKLIDNSKRQIRLEVDGGINKETIKQVAKAGADIFVAGNAIFNTSDYQQAIEELRAGLV